MAMFLVGLLTTCDLFLCSGYLCLEPLHSLYLFRSILGYGFFFCLSTNYLTTSDWHGVVTQAFLTYSDLIKAMITKVICSIYHNIYSRLIIQITSNRSSSNVTQGRL